MSDPFPVLAWICKGLEGFVNLTKLLRSEQAKVGQDWLDRMAEAHKEFTTTVEVLFANEGKEWTR